MEQAFEALFVTEYPRVVGVANRVLVDRAEAEDVAQEVFLDFHRHHSPTAPYAAAWLHRAAWHTALPAPVMFFAPVRSSAGSGAKRTHLETLATGSSALCEKGHVGSGALSGFAPQ